MNVSEINNVFFFFSCQLFYGLIVKIINKSNSRTKIDQNKLTLWMKWTNTHLLLKYYNRNTVREYTDNRG